MSERGTSLAETGVDALLAATLDADGLGLAHLPKGLVPFHRYGEGYVRTPFEEHLVEAAGHVRSGDGLCRLHFTVLAAHEELFRSHLGKVRSRLESELGARFEVSFSFQEPSTDTVAGDPDGGPFRDSEGRLVFRPGGHGSLIGNLGKKRSHGLDAFSIYETWTGLRAGPHNLSGQKGNLTDIGIETGLLASNNGERYVSGINLCSHRAIVY